jgi:hypothetical protein
MGAAPGSRRQIYISAPIHLRLRLIAAQHGIPIRALAEHVLGDEAHVRALAQQHGRRAGSDEELADK